MFVADTFSEDMEEREEGRMVVWMRESRSR